MDAWERWRIVCLAALSVEDIEDIYLFGTMITGILLIGLGFALGYRRIQKTGTAVQSLTRLPVRGKLTVLETRMDKESSRGIGMRLLALRQNNRNLIFFGSLAQWPWQGRCWKNYPWEGHCSEMLLLPPPFYRH